MQIFCANFSQTCNSIYSAIHLRFLRSSNMSKLVERFDYYGSNIVEEYVNCWHVQSTKLCISLGKHVNPKKPTNMKPIERRP